MVILGFIGLLLGLAIFLGPQMWTKYILSRHAKDRADCPGTGAELAEHLIAEYGLDGVTVEALPDEGDHYDPKQKVIRLSPRVHDGRSVTAVTVAAHEFGHALQDHLEEPSIRRRTVLVKQVFWIDRIGSAILMLAPLALFLGPVRGLSIMLLMIGVCLSLIRVAVHLMTLPVELDASFRKALPILERGGYLPPDEIPAARHILRACAMTYVSASLMSVLNLFRWLRR